MTSLPSIQEDLRVSLEPLKILQSLHRREGEGESDEVQNEVELSFNLAGSRSIDFRDSRFEIQFNVSDRDENQALTSNTNLGTLRGPGEEDIHQFDGGKATIKVANLVEGQLLTFQTGPIVTSYQPGPSLVRINSIDVPGYSDHSFQFTLKKIAHVFIRQFNIGSRRSRWEDNKLKVVFEFDWEVDYADNGVTLKYEGGKFGKFDPKERELVLTNEEIEEYPSVKLVAKGKIVNGRKNSDRVIREIKFPNKRIGECFQILSYNVQTNSLVIFEDERAKRDLRFYIGAKGEGEEIEITKEKKFFVALFNANHLQIQNPDSAFSIDSKDQWGIKHVQKIHPETSVKNFFWYLSPPENSYILSAENSLRFRISEVFANVLHPETKVCFVCFGFEKYDEDYFTEYLHRSVPMYPLMKLSSFCGLVQQDNEVIRLTFAVENAVRATLSYQCTDEAGAVLQSSKHWSYDEERLKKGGTWSGEQEDPPRHESEGAGTQIRQFFHNPEGQRSDNNSATLILYGGGGQIHTATWVKTKDVSMTNFKEYPDVI